jgi:hypothetical protein
LDAIKFAREEGVKLIRISSLSVMPICLSPLHAEPTGSLCRAVSFTSGRKGWEILLGQVNQDAEERKPQRIVLESRVVVNS